MADAPLDAQDADEQVLRADVGVQHRSRPRARRRPGSSSILRKGGARRSRRCARRRRVHLRSRGGLSSGLTGSGRKISLDCLLPFPEDPQQDVLGLDDPAAQLARLRSGRRRVLGGPSRCTSQTFGSTFPQVVGTLHVTSRRGEWKLPSSSAMPWDSSTPLTPGGPPWHTARDDSTFPSRSMDPTGCKIPARSLTPCPLGRGAEGVRFSVRL